MNATGSIRNSDTGMVLGIADRDSGEHEPNNMVKVALFISCYKGLWKLDGTTLSNKAGITLTGNWVLPSKGNLGTIQNTDAGVNGYLTANGNTAAGSAVVEDALHNKHEWYKSKEVSGYFTLMNINIEFNCEKFLTGQSSGTPNLLTIEGDDFYLFVCL